jgi:hypothetical protein
MKPLAFTMCLGLVTLIALGIIHSEFADLLFSAIWMYSVACWIVAKLEGE